MVLQKYKLRAILNVVFVIGTIENHFQFYKLYNTIISMDHNYYAKILKSSKPHI